MFLSAVGMFICELGVNNENFKIVLFTHFLYVPSEFPLSSATKEGYHEADYQENSGEDHENVQPEDIHWKKNINFRIKCVDRQHDNSDGYHGNSIVTVEILSVAIETSVSYPDNK